MGRPKKQYAPGDKIGTYQLTIVKEVAPHITAGGTKFRQFEVICPNCKKHFVTKMQMLNRKKDGQRAPVKQCPECSQKENNIRIANIGKEMVKDLTGQKFGKLTVLHMTEKREGRSVIWHCLCDCGNEVDVCMSKIQNGHTQSCGCLKSKGEQLIGEILRENNINYESQKIFKDCTNPEDTCSLKFDFYLPDYNCCIEYDGEQHFKSIDFYGGEEKFKRTQLLDSIKNQYCIDHNIRMIRIPYTDFNDIDIDFLMNKIK